jgi:hypothetical protein
LVAAPRLRGHFDALRLDVPRIGIHAFDLRRSARWHPIWAIPATSPTLASTHRSGNSPKRRRRRNLPHSRHDRTPPSETR